MRSNYNSTAAALQDATGLCLFGVLFSVQLEFIDSGQEATGFVCHWSRIRIDDDL